MDIITWIHGASVTDFWLLVTALIIVCLICLVQGFLYLIRKRTIEDTPTSRVRSAAQGYVELDGRCELMDGPPILSPLTGRECVWYEYSIQERRRSGRRHRWITTASGRSSDLFLLVEATGQCVIDPEGARVTASASQSWYGDSRDSQPGITGRRWLSLGSRYKFKEAWLQPGDPLYAIGLFETVGGNAGGLDKNALMRHILREWKQDADRLLQQYDTNSDGEIGIEEWEAVRASAWKEVQRHHAELKQAQPVHMLAATHDRRRPFLLSAVPQFDLVGRYQFFMLCLFSGALLTAAAASWLATTRLAGA